MFVTNFYASDHISCLKYPPLAGTHKIELLVEVLQTFNNWIFAARQSRPAAVYPSTWELFWFLAAAYGLLPALPPNITI